MRRSPARFRPTTRTAKTANAVTIPGLPATVIIAFVFMAASPIRRPAAEPKDRSFFR
jgi:hypothetical protein